MEIVDSKNIFVNSELNVVGDGTEFQISFPSQVFSAKYPAQIRLTCLQFVTRRSWFQVNQTNNMWFILIRNGLVRMYPFEIPVGDYPTFEALATAISDQWNLVDCNPALLNNFVSGFIQPGNTIPYPALPAISSTTAAGTLGAMTCTYNQTTRAFRMQWASNNGLGGLPPTLRPFLPFSLQTRTQAGIEACLPTSLTTFVTAQMTQAFADVLGQQGQFSNAWEILGGRVSRPNNPQLLFQQNATLWVPPIEVFYLSNYPAQLSTLEAIYLRTNIIGNNYQTLGFEKDPNSNNDVELIPSTILCKIPIHSAIATRWTSWQLAAGPPITYQMTDANIIVFQDFVGSQNLKIGGQNLTFCTIGMTDAEGRTIPPVSALQASSGNLNCKITLRFEVITSPETAQLMREAAALNPPTPAFEKADGVQQEIGNQKAGFIK